MKYLVYALWAILAVSVGYLAVSYDQNQSSSKVGVVDAIVVSAPFTPATSANPEALAVASDIAIAPYSANPEALRSGSLVTLPAGQTWFYTMTNRTVSVNNESTSAMVFDSAIFDDVASNANCPAHAAIHFGNFDPVLYWGSFTPEGVTDIYGAVWGRIESVWLYACKLTGQPPVGSVIFNM